VVSPPTWHARRVQLFEEVAEAVRGLAPDDLGTFHHRTHRYGTKIWFGDPDPPREHYEAQVIGATHVPEADALAVEVGFHAEHRDPAVNETVIAGLRATEAEWRGVLGPDAEVGPFLGRDGWARVSETWPDPDLEDPELGMDLAARLVDYLAALEPARRPAPG
jgi:hypothetical protein